MSSSPKLPTADRVAEPFAGASVSTVSVPGKGDLSDWIELMEAVEALCPVWPQREERSSTGTYKL
jgi:hypothetical protein